MATTKPRKATAAPTPAAAAPPAVPAPSHAQGAAGLPRWVLILGALVPVCGLVWGGVTHFVPKVEPAPVPSVSMSGSGNVGVGVMSGGTINNGGGGIKP